MKPKKPTKDQLIEALIKGLGAFAACTAYGVKVSPRDFEYRAFMLYALSGRDAELAQMCREFANECQPKLNKAAIKQGD